MPLPVAIGYVIMEYKMEKAAPTCDLLLTIPVATGYVAA